jgi:hypothetical protein
MRKITILVVIGVLVYAYAQERGISLTGLAAFPGGADSTLQQAFENRQSDLQVRGRGTVVRVLTDDLDGSRHQRFILRLETGQTLLVAHNIDLAPRVDGLETGDQVEFFGEYEWNARGGVIHWTHRDPANVHVAGWLRHRGILYQ